VLAALDLRCRKCLALVSLEEQVRERHPDVQRLADILDGLPPQARVGEKEESRLKELRGLLDRMGDVNLTAIEESEELQKRYDFLTSQEGRTWNRPFARWNRPSRRATALRASGSARSSML